jgi:ankyrin repeat protein
VCVVQGAKTPLLVACYSAHQRIAEMLTKAGADTSIRNQVVHRAIAYYSFGAKSVVGRSHMLIKNIFFIEVQ